jgi:hypothetical protein
MVAIHYVLRVKIIKSKNDAGNLEIFEFENQFKDDTPVRARESAFKKYQNYIDVFLEEQGKQYTS